ncbi:hypothetical protein ACFE04_007546 [Oxalis oulophora]
MSPKTFILVEYWESDLSAVGIRQALDFYGALRSRTYDRSISKWVEEIGGVENLASKLLKRKKDENLPVFTPPEQSMEALLESGYSLIREQKLIMETKLSKEYMKNMNDD